MGFELVYLGSALLGVLIVLGLSRTAIPMWALGLAPAGVCVGALILLAATYKDEFCDEDTACRLFAEPSFVVLVAMVPGMAVGWFVASAWRRRP